jgi:hypothetical protein
MLLSIRHKFAFIHIYKTAGTSIAAALRPYAHGPVRTLLHRTGLLQPRIPKLPNHATAQQVARALPAHYRQLFTFAFVRNPWDWQVSLYEYMRQTPVHHQHSLAVRMNFEEYIDWRVTCDKHLQLEFINDASGEQMVDFIGRFENLRGDFREICTRLAIAAPLPHLNRSSRRDYRAYYNVKTRAQIQKHFAADIEFFGYSF